MSIPLVSVKLELVRFQHYTTLTKHLMLVHPSSPVVYTVFVSFLQTNEEAVHKSYALQCMYISRI